MDFAHSKVFIDGDIKLAKELLTADGAPKIPDVGLVMAEVRVRRFGLRTSWGSRCWDWRSIFSWQYAHAEFVRSTADDERTTLRREPAV